MRDATRAAEAGANQNRLWTAPAKRERLLAEVIGEEEAHPSWIEAVMKEHRLACVVHSEEVAQMLETFAGEGNCLLRVISSLRGTTPRRWASRDHGLSSKSRSEGHAALAHLHHPSTDKC
jgi:hypothetical protein